MRILFTACPMFGHVNPILPLAVAARDAGHDVVVASGAEVVPHIAGRALATWTLRGPSASGPDWLTYFATSAAARAADLVPLAVDWKPDLVVSEDTELAGPVAAAAAGARHVVHGIGQMPAAPLWDMFGPLLDDLAARHGVTGLAAGHRDATYLELCPPSLRPAGERIWARTLDLRPVAGGPRPGERLPAVLDALPYARTVHLTLGTVFHRNRDVLRTALTALAALPVNVVATVGDPNDLGEQPANVLVAPYLPHTLLLPRCAAVVSQGGAGILFGTLAHGLPQLVLPQGGDQAGNAAAVVRAGAGLALEQVTAADVAAATARLLAEPSFTTAAGWVRDEIAAMPAATSVLASL